MTRPRWKFYTGDCNWLDHGGTWLKRHEDYFEFVELCHYNENEKYIMFYASIDHDDIALTRDDVRYAILHCDLEPDENNNYDYADLAYALFTYARHDDVETGNNAYKMLKSWGIHRP